MNWLVAVWTVIVGVCLAFGLTNFTLWLRGRGDAHVRFLLTAALAVAVSVFGYVELRLMTLQSPAEALPYLRAAHPIAFVIVALMALLVHVRFGTGRLWLLAAALAVRLALVVAGFFSPVNVNYLEVQSLRTVSLLGQQATVIGDAVLNPWARLGPVAVLLFLAYVIDASIGLWRKGDPMLRGRALLVGGSIVVAVVLSSAVAIPKHAGVLDLPYIVAPSFLLVVLAMTYELTTDLLRSEELSGRLQATSAVLGLTQQRLQLATAAAGVGFWEWDVRRDEVRITEPAARLLGLTLAQPIPAAAFFDTLQPDDQAAVRAAALRAAASGDEFDVWVRLHRSDGRQRWVGLRGKATRDGSGQATMVLGVVMDVTERQEADQRVRAIAKSLPIGVLMVNSGGLIVFANHKVESIFGYDHGELIGQPVDRLVPVAMRRQHAEERSAFRHGARAMFQGRDVLGMCKDGDTMIVEVWLSSARIQDEHVTVASVLDNTWRRNAELELGKRREELAHLSRVAMLGELSGSLAHELNQPLTAILSNAQASQQLAAKGRLDTETLNDVLADIVADTRRAGEVIRGLRSLVRRGEVVLEGVDVNAVALEVLGLMGSDLIDRRVAVVTALAPGLPPVLADRVQLQQVILNLIVNACDAMKDAPAPRQLVVSTAADGSDPVRVSISDTGTGIPADQLDRIFERFVTTKREGLGMGLSVCRTIIEHFGGKIVAANNPARGATFHFTLRSAPSQA
jgi:two-component system sensor kinase FixL